MGTLVDILATARRTGHPALMVDVKCRSPRDGVLIPLERLESYVRAVLAAGVDALATPTDPVHFGGGLDIARRIRRVAGVPLMRKEFFRSVAQIDESRDAGFDAVQLTLSTIGDVDLFRAMRTRAHQLGLDVIVGIHNTQQLEQAISLGATAVAVNNRDITVLELDDGTVNHSETVLSQIPSDILVISQSSFHTRADVERAVRAGADAVLVGTAIAKSPDPGMMVSSLRDGFKALQS